MDSLEGFDIHYATPKDMPEVKFAQGSDTIKAIHLEVENTKFDEMLEFTNLDEAFRNISTTLIRQHRSALKKMKYTSRTMYTSSKGPFVPKKYKRRFSIYVPPELYKSKGEISTFGDKVILISTQTKNLCVIIRDKCIAETMKDLMNLAWTAVEQLKELK